MAEEGVPWFAPHLDRVRLLLKRHILRRARWLPAPADESAHQALVEFLGEDASQTAWRDVDVELLSEALGLRAASAAEESWRFEELVVGLRLTDVEQLLLWVLLAPEYDMRFLHVYRMLWGGERRRYCDEDFLLELLHTQGFHEIHPALGPERPLLALRFVETLAPDPLSSRLFRPSRRLLSYLNDADEPPAELSARVQLHGPAAPPAWRTQPLLPLAAQEVRRDRGRHRIVMLLGDDAQSAVLMVRQLMAEIEQQVLVCDLAPWITVALAGGPHGGAEVVEGLRAVLRERRLQRAALMFVRTDALGDLTLEQQRTLYALLAQEHGPVFLHVREAMSVEYHLYGAPLLQPLLVRLDRADGLTRAALWAHLLGADKAPELRHLARNLGAYPIGPLAMEVALAEGAGDRRRLESACERLVTHHFGGMASRVRVTCAWDEVVLAEQTRRQFEEIRTLGLHYRAIMEEWRLGRASSGHGIKLLLSGPSGTGKTLMSGILAQELGQELFRVDLGAVMSKYIGETEKQLSQLFDRASASGVALLFDEADSLFAKRTEVKSSHDRYANQTTNFLLQKLEDFEGLAILTTNLDRSIDEAFLRRLHFHVRFPVPTVEERQALWQMHMPPSLPVADDIDLAMVAEAYEITGGQIRKAVLRAAILAKQRRGIIDLAALADAVRAEYLEAGKLPPTPLDSL